MLRFGLKQNNTHLPWEGHTQPNPFLHLQCYENWCSDPSLGSFMFPERSTRVLKHRSGIVVWGRAGDSKEITEPRPLTWEGKSAQITQQVRGRISESNPFLLTHWNALSTHSNICLWPWKNFQCDTEE